MTHILETPYIKVVTRRFENKDQLSLEIETKLNRFLAVENGHTPFSILSRV